MANQSPQGLPMEYHPNPLVHSSEYKDWSQATAPKVNVHGGSTVWCKTDQILDHTNISLNQRLAGLPDPKTLVQPMIPIPIYNNDIWKANDFMVPSGINDQRRQELWQNGYLTEDISQYVRKNYLSKNETECPSRTSVQVGPSHVRGVSAHAPPSPQVVFPSSSSLRNQSPVQENFTTDFGYDPKNMSYDLPTNYPAGRCRANKDMRDYNANIFTNTIQPGVYSTSQVNQQDSVMANLGISYTQPHLPTYSSFTQRRHDNVDALEDGILYTEYDPNFAPQPSCETPVTGVHMDTVYDPRFYGYGTGYRSYVDQLTGRPKFFYDDIDVHRRNKFITRNALDTEGFGLQTGPQEMPKYTNMEVREMAQNSFLDNALSFRTDLQQRLMRKNNNRAWQQKQAPITRNQFTRGGSSKAAGLTSTGYAGPRG